LLLICFSFYLRSLLLYLLPHNARYQHKISQQTQNNTQHAMIIAILCHTNGQASILPLAKLSGEYFSFQTLLSFMC